ncbi:protein lev-9-like isoform X2 [Gigantopelta aegis]|uniref:protein lev-9-like isoform X2 n=1 Tax=Gigantopelta aegis TaxID=1735272 RepID=UPI001B88BBF1|nr:protein lev-9-like isoform X2 [Gigantopelta aegis]
MNHSSRLLLTCLLPLFLLSTVTVVCEFCPRKEHLARRQCKKKCVDTCLSSKKKCLCDGACGKSCINPNLRCQELGKTIPNGRIEIIPFNQFGAVAKYYCNDGYTLFGLPARVCQGDETWSGDPPVCRLNHDAIEKHECGAPPFVNNAFHNGQGVHGTYPLGSMLQYQCNEGYTARKDRVDRAWCVGGGVWVGPNMTCDNPGCPILPEIAHGSAQIISNHINGTARYYCDQGYHLAGRSIRKCLENGTWGGMTPTCEEVVCGWPPAVEHATHDNDPDQAQFPAGTQLIYTCAFGYYREGIPRSMCSGAEGTWIGPRMSCKARDCGSPGEIQNGWRDPGYRFTYPSRVTYHCHEGYELIGKSYRDCLASGDWSETLPTCIPIDCPELGPPLHGTMIGSGTMYGSVIRFVCNDGFKVVGSSERRCQSDRTWSGQDAVCEEINCGVPGPIWNGYLDGHRTTVGAVYFYRCHTRTKFKGASFSTQCLENGQWSYPPPLCMGQCQVPAILNGTLLIGREGVWVDDSTVVNYECKNGLVLNDTAPVSCNNGTWTVIPRCVPAPCKGPPPNIQNGHRVFFGLRHGDKSRYFCMEGYRLHHNSKYLSCQYGAWSGPRPYCEENFCPNPGEITNGKVYKKGHVGKFLFRNFIVTIKHGDRLEYECHRGYKLKGPKGAACVNGKWSPDESPKCVKSRHPIFHKLWRPAEEEEASRQYGY